MQQILFQIKKLFRYGNITPYLWMQNLILENFARTSKSEHNFFIVKHNFSSLTCIRYFLKLRLTWNAGEWILKFKYVSKMNVKKKLIHRNQ